MYRAAFLGSVQDESDSRQLIQELGRYRSVQDVEDLVSHLLIEKLIE